MSTTLSLHRGGRGAAQSALNTLAEMRELEPLVLYSATVATGFVPLDDVLGGGPRPGELVVVGGKPAVERDVTVVAIAAADHVGLASRRLHLHHFRGSTAIAYEADAIIMLNEKADIVSRVHFASAPTRLEEFRRQVVFTIEKNRSGMAGAELEFYKDFANYRFEPHGSWVAERLWSQNSLGAMSVVGVTAASLLAFQREVAEHALTHSAHVTANTFIVSNAIVQGWRLALRSKEAQHAAA